jgi:two-component sensor histidine kinase
MTRRWRIQNCCALGVLILSVAFASEPGRSQSSEDRGVRHQVRDKSVARRPSAKSALGMTIIRSFVERIGGELRIGRGDKNHGTRITVLFSGDD